MNEQEKEILKYLEQSYDGARAMGDENCQIRLARAIAAFEADPEMSACDLFAERFIAEIPHKIRCYAGLCEWRQI